MIISPSSPPSLARAFLFSRVTYHSTIDHALTFWMFCFLLSLVMSLCYPLQSPSMRQGDPSASAAAMGSMRGMPMNHVSMLQSNMSNVPGGGPGARSPLTPVQYVYSHQSMPGVAAQPVMMMPQSQAGLDQTGTYSPAQGYVTSRGTSNVMYSTGSPRG